MSTKRLWGFIETSAFQSAWTTCGLALDDLFELQGTLQSMPTIGPVVSGTGGLRKVRFSPSRLRRGKRRAYRVGYVVFDRIGLIALLAVCSKNMMATLSSRDKSDCKAVIQFLKSQWEKPQ